MIRPGRTLAAALLLLTMGQWTTVSAQGDCLNEDLYPFDPTTPSAEGVVTIISECSFEQEHSVITGIEAGLYYDFTLSSGGYITIRQGAVDGTVLAQGYSPVYATAATADDLFVHWNTNDACGRLDECVVTTGQRLECAPSTSTLTFAEDCDLQSYTITLDITSLGDAGARCSHSQPFFSALWSISVQQREARAASEQLAIQTKIGQKQLEALGSERLGEEFCTCFAT